MICRICLLDLVLNVYKRISGDAHDIQLVVNSVKTADHDGIGIVAYLIGTGNKEGIHAVFSALNMIAIGAVAYTVAVSFGWGRKNLQGGIRADCDHYEYEHDDQNDLAGLFLFALFVSCRYDLVNTFALCLLMFRCLAGAFFKLIGQIVIVTAYHFTAVSVFAGVASPAGASPALFAAK